MNVALFGGTFDPIHCGHLSAARAARDSLALDRVYFIPSGHPPHRSSRGLTAFEHRYAMVALACGGEPGFFPSLAEAPSRRGPHYSIRTVRRFRKELAGAHLYFVVGVDAFLEFRTWWRWRALLDSVNLIIVSRPGFPLERVEKVLPREMVAGEKAAAAPASPQLREIRLPRTRAIILSGVSEPVSATEVRARARQGKPLDGLVPPGVADYIAKQRLYA